MCVMEALFTAIFVRIIFIFLPFSEVIKLLGTPGSEPVGEISNEISADICTINDALSLIQKNSILKMSCYVQALTAKKMLKRRKIVSTVYLGFCRDENGILKGHAWLSTGNFLFTGRVDLSSYSIHSCFT